MMEMFYKVFAPQNESGLLLFLAILIVLGVLLYHGYRMFYEKRINRALEGHTVKVASIETIMIFYFITAIICALLYMGGVYAKDTTKEEKVCRESYGYVDFFEGEEAIEERIEELQKKAKTSFTRQEKTDEDGLVTIYAEANQKEFVYVIYKPLNRKPLEGENFYVSVRTKEGTAASYMRIDKDVKGVGMMRVGENWNVCPNLDYSVNIYNFTKGKNTDPIDIQKEVKIKKGGVEIK